MTAQNLPPRLLIGLSGGADSVALMLMLIDRGVTVVAVHVNHGLRGDESDGDEAFVRELCERLGVALLVYRASPPENPGENWAREVRYGFYRQAAQQTGLNDIALAHHQDDQAETLLMHLLRGSGLTGLTAMQPLSRQGGLRIHRPLLNEPREELRRYLQSRHQPWREDATNLDPRYLRNALRMQLLPEMERLVPGASERLARTARILADDEDTLRRRTEAFLQPFGGARELPLTALQEEAPGMQRRILRAWYNTLTGNALNADQTEHFRALIDASASARCNLPGGCFGYRGWTHLHLTGLAELPLTETPAGESHLLRVEDFTGDYGDGKSCQAVPREWLSGCTVRTRRSGDRIRPFGSSGSRKLQDYLTDRRIDAPFRDRIPLICRGGEVLLIGGVGAGAVPRMTQNDDPVLLRWTASFPWHGDDKDGGKNHDRDERQDL